MYALIGALGIIAAALVTPSDARSEPLRILVAKFTGAGGVGDYFTTTLYFELMKGFTNQAEKGVWIVYGREPLADGTYEAAIDRASLPSNRADIVIWGSVTAYGDGQVVQSFLGVTPIIDERKVRPEIWQIEKKVNNGLAVAIEIGLPKQFYDFEPFSVPNALIQKYRSLKGVPLYSLPSGGSVIGHVDGAFTFSSDNRENSIKVSLDSGASGWVHLTDLYREKIQASEFSQGLLRYLRGDWVGARDLFQEIVEIPDLPQSIRIDALLLLGAAEERLGNSGVNNFRHAYQINPFNKVSAQYLIMGELSEISRLVNERDKINSKQELAGLFRLCKKSICCGRPLA